MTCYAVAGLTSIQSRPHPLGDGMVPAASALGRHRDPRLNLAFPSASTRVVAETNH